MLEYVLFFIMRHGTDDICRLRRVYVINMFASIGLKHLYSFEREYVTRSYIHLIFLEQQQTVDGDLVVMDHDITIY